MEASEARVDSGAGWVREVIVLWGGSCRAVDFPTFTQSNQRAYKTQPAAIHSRQGGQNGWSMS